MSVGFIRSNVVRKLVSVVCLLTFPAVAQQANTGLSMQATPVAGQSSSAASASQQSGTAGGSQQSATANAPEPKKLPQPTHEDYSKPTPLLPNPFARYIPRDVP